MTKLLQRIDMSVQSFYVFNSSFGQKDGEEHKKILFYFPDDIELNTKIKDVGLSEAIIAFTGTFTEEDKCKALHTQKTTQIFYQPEKGFWMVMVINVPKEIRLKDGIEIAEYKGNEVQDRIYNSVLEQCYNIFRFFVGTFQLNVTSNEEKLSTAENLRSKLDLFYSKYLLTLKLPSSDIVDTLRSVQYVPLNKTLFLRVHNFLYMIQATFSTIKESIFLYNEGVVCSKISPTDLYSVHEYLITTVFPKITHADLSCGPTTNIFLEYNQSGSFITGPEGPQHPNSTKAPKVNIIYNGKLVCFALIIYRVMNATLCLFVDVAEEQTSEEFYTELHSFMGPQLFTIASDIGEMFTSNSSTKIPLTSCDDKDSPGPKFLYVNEQSLMHFGNIFMDRKRLRHHSMPANVLNIIADLKQNNDTNDEEVLVKSTSDFWIVKKRCNWRQFYVIIFNSKSTLLDITNEAKKVFDQEFIDDVFFDK